MNIYDIVRKLTGSLEPVGETNFDRKVYENLEEIEELLIPIITDLVYTSKEKDRVEASRKKCGEKAKEILESITSEIETLARKLIIEELTELTVITYEELGILFADLITNGFREAKIDTESSSTYEYILYKKEEEEFEIFIGQAVEVIYHKNRTEK